MKQQALLPGVELPKPHPSVPAMDVHLDEEPGHTLLPDPGRLLLPGIEALCPHPAMPAPDMSGTAEPGVSQPQDTWPAPASLLGACPFEIHASSAHDASDENTVSGTLTVLGLGIADSLPAPHTQIISQATLLAGGRRLLNRFATHPAPKLIYGSPAPMRPQEPQPGWEEGGIGDSFIQTLARYRAQGHTIVVLADGDPLFFGIGTSLCKAFPAVRIIPAVSCLQEACARLGCSWTDTATVSLHGRTDWRPFTAALLDHKPLCVLTDAHSSPDLLARFMLDRGADAYAMHVFTNLGTPEEQYQPYSLRAAATAQGLSSACTVLLLPEGTARPLCLGLDGRTLATENGLFTKQPIRAAALAALGIAPDDTVWDIGAGSGAVSLEAAFLARQGQVFACEHNEARVLCIQENRRRFGAANLEIHTGKALETSPKLPTPQKIFVGGGLNDNHASELLHTLCTRLAPQGRICISCVLFGTLELCRAYFRQHKWAATVLCLNFSEGQPLAQDVHLVAGNPVFLVCATKENQ